MSNYDSPSTNSKYSRHKGYLKWELANKDVNGAFDDQQLQYEKGLLIRDKQTNSQMIPSIKSVQPSQISPDVSTIREHICCDKLDELSKQYQYIINEQMNKLTELNLLIQQHSKLLIDSYNQGLEDAKTQQIKEQQIIENNRLIRERDRQIQEWEEKYNKEKKIGDEKEEEIRELEKQLKELQTQVVITTSSTDLENEKNQWKNKFITLNKQFNETEQQVVVLENEIDMLKQQQKKTEVRTTTRRKTVTKDIPLP
ncbi:unnamed protein product [Paramecium pentaurelia]|uniref:Uncharacterized protein n=1 Tax=Paramecium pentaurelia TaxID=43138 RepID=A0A8S1VNA7_9CILI|nr:unnamed protein product [Paramecium pentaurelia]